MKNINLSISRNNSKILLFVVSFFFTRFSLSQSFIDSTYQFEDSITLNPIDAMPNTDFNVCSSNRKVKNYIAATSFKYNLSGFNLFNIKLLEFDSSGKIIKSNVIKSIEVLNLIITDIKPNFNGIGYVLCGYIDALSGNQPMHPFIITIDNDLKLLNAKVLQLNGMFSRIAPSNNSYYFVGYLGDSTDAVCPKQGFVFKTDLTLSTSIGYAIPAPMISQSFTNINDIKLLPNGDLILAGSIMNFNGSCIEIRTVIFRLNSMLVLLWQNNEVGISMTNPKIDVLGKYIYVIINGENPVSSAIVKYDTTGICYGGAFFEANNFLNCENNLIATHIPYCQNIKCLGVDTVMITGKFILYSEFFFDVKIDLSNANPGFWNFYNAHVNYTTYRSVNTDLLSYRWKVGANSCIDAMLIQPIYSSNNTVWLTKELIPVSVTYTYLRFLNASPFKTWTFTNGYSFAYGFQNINIYNAGNLILKPKLFPGYYLNFTPTIFLPSFNENNKIFNYQIKCNDRGNCCTLMH